MEKKLNPSDMNRAPLNNFWFPSPGRMFVVKRAVKGMIELSEERF
jgi:hypothetical protein